jgi:hypothetical protein
MLACRCNEQQYCAEHRQNYFQDSFTAHDRSSLTEISILASRGRREYTLVHIASVGNLGIAIVVPAYKF